MLNVMVRSLFLSFAWAGAVFPGNDIKCKPMCPGLISKPRVAFETCFVSPVPARASTQPGLAGSQRKVNNLPLYHSQIAARSRGLRAHLTALRAKPDCIDDGAAIVIVGANTDIGSMVVEQLESTTLQLRLVGDSAQWASEKSRSSSAEVYLGSVAQDPASHGMEELFVCRAQGPALSATPISW